jgi:hypothetical protein
MATITSATSGNWAVGATWVGGVAPNYLTDIAVIASGHKVTIASSATIPATTVGPPANGVSTTELEIASGVTVTLAGNLMIDPGNNANATTLTTITHQAGSTLNLVTFKYGNTGGGNAAGSRFKSVINNNGTTDARSYITGSAGSQIKFMDNLDWAFTYNRGFIDWDYVTISGVDSGTEANFIHGYFGFKFDHVLYKNSAVMVAGNTIAGNNFILQNSDFRSLTTRAGGGLPNSIGSISCAAPSGAESRIFTSNTFRSSALALTFSGFIIQNSIWDGDTLVFANSSNMLAINCAFYQPLDAGFSISYFYTNTNIKINSCIFHYENNAHGMSPSGGTDVYLKNSVITADDGAADPLYGVGNDDWIVANNLLIGQPGSAVNLTYGKFINNTFAMNTDPIYIQEVGTPANHHGDSIFYNNLFLDLNNISIRTYLNPMFALSPPYTTDSKQINYVDYNAWVPKYNNQGGTFNKYGMPTVCQYTIRYDGQNPVKKDLRLNSQLTGTSAATFEIEIVDGTASPNTYKWRKDGGAWSTPIPVSVSWVLISSADNIYAQWGSTTGHTTLDNYKFDYVFLTQGQLGFGSQDTALTLTPAQVQFKWSQDSPVIPRDIDVYRNYLLSTTGSIRSDWFTDAVKRNGFDRSGTAASFNAGFDPMATLTWIKAGWETTSTVLATGGIGGSYIGAFVPIAPPIGSNIWNKLFYSRIFS